MTRQKISEMTILGLAMIFAVSVNAFAEERKAEEPKANSTSNVTTVEGQVIWIGKEKIAITYSKDADGMEHEILLPFDAGSVMIEHKRNLGEINVGDTVRVQYEEESREYSDGRKEGKLKAKVISFLRPAPPKPKAPASEDEEEAMPLKGIR